ncbi:hypothetical protein [Saccharopolyspora sp. 6M]|uniref:hypothetical protein n=1 Tax=Saccharopolyspora sp. 6M TaxID=2877237 RepID=UPI001CD24987|nr:hypothetical protein [Saccharopolyspora sp. 6M]MCA1229765.1 hypothetical protein [Saccharopolyspora sp. 6M]
MARRWWCAADEPIVWAFQVTSRTFRVEGCNEYGRPLPPEERKRRSFASSAGRAVGKAGLSAATVLGTAVFGGGDDAGVRQNETKRVDDLTILGGSPECRAVQLHNSERPPDASAIEQVWVLTPRRFAVLIPVGRPAPVEREEPGALREWGETLSGMGRILAGTEPEKFGRNAPGERIDPERMVEWLSFTGPEFADCRPVVQGNTAHCVLTLQDGSGFALNARSPEGARLMAEGVQGFVRGARG